MIQSILMANMILKIYPGSGQSFSCIFFDNTVSKAEECESVFSERNVAGVFEEDYCFSCNFDDGYVDSRWGWARKN